MCTGKLRFRSTEFSTSRYDQPVYISSYLKSSFLCRYMISLRNVSGCLPVLVSISLYTKESGCIILTRSMITLSDSSAVFSIRSFVIVSPGFTQFVLLLSISCRERTVKHFHSCVIELLDCAQTRNFLLF